jgi:hypothetical protein
VRQGGARDAIEAAEGAAAGARARPAAARSRSCAQPAQLRQREHRHAAAAIARGEQVGDPRAVGRQPGASAPGPSRRRVSGTSSARTLPRAHHRVGRGLALDAAARRQVELVAQAPHQGALGVAVAHRDGVAELDQAIAVDAGQRRIAVHQHRQDGDGVALVGDLQLDPRRLAPGQRRQALGPHLDRQLLAQLGQDLRRQHRPLRVAVQVLHRQVLEPGPDQVARGDGLQGGADPGHADGDDLGQLGRAGDLEQDVGAVIPRDGARHQRLGAAGDRLALPAHVLGAGQHREQPLELVAVDGAAARAQQLVGGEVGLGRGDLRAGGAAGDHGDERASQPLHHVAAHDLALDRHPAASRLDAVAHVATDVGRGRQRRRGAGLAVGRGDRQRQQRADDVRADGLAARAVALPLLVLEVEDDLERGGPGRHPHLELDLVAPLRRAADPAVAGQAHALRPGPLVGGGAGGGLELLDAGIHGNPQI